MRKKTFFFIFAQENFLDIRMFKDIKFSINCKYLCVSSIIQKNTHTSIHLCMCVMVRVCVKFLTNKIEFQVIKPKVIDRLVLSGRKSYIKYSHKNRSFIYCIDVCVCFESYLWIWVAFRTKPHRRELFRPLIKGWSFLRHQP